jgi:acyl carrier protein
MATQDRSTSLRVERLGMGMLTPQRGLAALQQLLLPTEQHALVAAVPFRLERLAQQAQRGEAVAPIFAALVPEVVRADVAARRPQARLADAKARVLAEVNAALLDILGVEIAPSQPLMAAGLDSLASVEFQNSLETRMGAKMPGTLIFDYPTVESLVDFLARQQSAAGSAAPAAELAAVDAEEHLRQVQSDVAAVVAEVLGVAQVAPEEPLMAAGLDSLGAVELKNSLEGRLGLQLPGTLVFDYPTTAALAGYVATRLQPAAAFQELDVHDDGLVPTEGHFAGISVAGFATRSPKVRAWGIWISRVRRPRLPRDPSAQGPHASGPLCDVQGALKSSLDAVDGTVTVPLQRWDVEEQAVVLGTSPIRLSPLP